MKTFFRDFFTIIGAIVSAFGIIIIAPFISFYLAYFGGWLCSLVIGDILAEGLNFLFNTTHFTKDMIPLCAAALGWIGGYFKTKSTKISMDD